MLSSLIGRLPIGIAGLAILLMVQSATGSFSQAGSTTAAYIAGLALVAPAVGRYIDRHGPHLALYACSLLYPLLLLLLIGLVVYHAPYALVIALAVIAGACYPPITPCMRTFLRRALGESPLLATAYSVESMMIESIFIVGPVLVAILAGLASPIAAVLTAAACGLAGTQMFLRTPALTRWRVEPRQTASLFGPLADRRFRLFLSVIVCYSGAFGLVEIGVAAYATEAGTPAFAGVLLGLMSVGSALGALTYGSRHWHQPLNRQFATTLALMGAGIAPLMIISNPWLFGAYCIPAGVVMAPAMIIQSMLVARSVGTAQSTEAFTWSSTCLLAGVGLGFTVGGFVVETAGVGAVFGAAALLSAGAGAVARFGMGGGGPE